MFDFALIFNIEIRPKCHHSITVRKFLNFFSDPTVVYSPVLNTLFHVTPANSICTRTYYANLRRSPDTGHNYMTLAVTWSHVKLFFIFLGRFRTPRVHFPQFFPAFSKATIKIVSLSIFFFSHFYAHALSSREMKTIYRTQKFYAFIRFYFYFLLKRMVVFYLMYIQLSL